MTVTTIRRIRQGAAMVLMALFTGGTHGPALAAAMQGVPDEVWSQLRVVLPGSELRLTLTDGSTADAVLVEANADAVVVGRIHIVTGRLVLPKAEDVTFARGDLSGLEVRKRIYPKAARRTLPRAEYRFKSTGAPDVAAVRRVVSLLGVSQMIDVRTTRPSKLRARILSIGETGFIVAHGRLDRAVPIAYSDVTELKPAGMHVAYKAAIGVGVGYAAAVALFFIVYSQCQCG